MVVVVVGAVFVVVVGDVVVAVETVAVLTVTDVLQSALEPLVWSICSAKVRDVDGFLTTYPVLNCAYVSELPLRVASWKSDEENATLVVHEIFVASPEVMVFGDADILQVNETGVGP